MLEAVLLREARLCEDEIKRVSRALHDLCQPLTMLQCRMELATLTDTGEAYREAVDLGLVDCQRLVQAVLVMRGILRAAAQAELEGIEQ